MGWILSRDVLWPYRWDSRWQWADPAAMVDIWIWCSTKWWRLQTAITTMTIFDPRLQLKMLDRKLRPCNMQISSRTVRFCTKPQRKILSSPRFRFELCLHQHSRHIDRSSNVNHYTILNLDFIYTNKILATCNKISLRESGGFLGVGVLWLRWLYMVTCGVWRKITRTGDGKVTALTRGHVDLRKAQEWLGSLDAVLTVVKRPVIKGIKAQVPRDHVSK